MEILITPDWAPNFHPLVVHFPIALLTVAVLANLITFFVPEKWWDEQKNTVLYVAGAILAIITYYTGETAVDSVFLPTEAQSVLTEHADWAGYLVWFVVLYAILRIVFHWFKLFEKKIFKVLAFAVVLPGLYMVYETAEYGAKMVYGYGTGTGQLLEQEEDDFSTSADSISAASTFIEKENGNWVWEMAETSVSDLISNFHWIQGGPQDMAPAIIHSGKKYLRLKASGSPNFFVTHGSYQNVQVDYYLNLDELEGEIELTHHVQDADNYDYVYLNSSGNIRQGRVQDGEETLFEEIAFEGDGELFIRVVADGTHFRGYINREMKVHGHGDAPQSGNVGIRLQGSGEVLISKIEMAQL